MLLLDISSEEKDQKSLKKSCTGWIESALALKVLERESRWTKSIAVGGKSFVEAIKTKLGPKVNYRKINEVEGAFTLKEQKSSYK